MTVDERTRHELYTRLEEVLGHEHAMTLMEHLPPVGWTDVATRRDLDALEQRLDARLDNTKDELLAAFRGELLAAVTNQTRTIMFTTLGSMTAFASVVLAMQQLGG